MATQRFAIIRVVKRIAAKRRRDIYKLLHFPVIKAPILKILSQNQRTFSFRLLYLKHIFNCQNCLLILAKLNISYSVEFSWALLLSLRIRMEAL